MTLPKERKHCTAERQRRHHSRDSDREWQYVRAYTVTEAKRLKTCEPAYGGVLPSLAGGEGRGGGGGIILFQWNRQNPSLQKKKK